MIRKAAAAAVLLLSVSLGARAQRVSVSTDVVTWANLGTANASVSVAVSRSVSLGLYAEYNPWTFRSRGGGSFQDRRQSYALGVRWWPWHIYSGWWFGAAGQYREYNRGGLLSAATEEGDAAGLALSVGHTLMLARGVNLDFGLGVWGGRRWYTRYSCPRCGRVTGRGSGWFVLPNDISVALMFVF